MKKKKWLIFILIVAVIAGYFLLKGSSQTSTGLPVKTAVVSRETIQSILSTNALIQSQKVKEYIGSGQYTVDKVYVEVGQKVKEGDILLTYDTADLLLAVQQAQLQLDNARLNKAELMAQKEQMDKDMLELEQQIFTLTGSTDPQDIATLQSLIQKRKSMQPISDEKIKLMDNSIEQAELNLRSAQDKLEKAQEGIVAEFDGVVTEVNAEEGTSLSMAQAAIVVKQLDNLKGVVKVGKYDAEKIKLGQKVTLKNSNNTYQGVVSFIDPEAKKDMGSTGEATLQVEIRIENPDEYLKIDFDINADILIAEASNALTAPLECLIFDRDDNATVFVVKDGKAVLIPVTIGMQSDTRAEILSGLEEGDELVANPPDVLVDGMPVSIAGEVK